MSNLGIALEDAVAKGVKLDDIILAGRGVKHVDTWVDVVPTDAEFRAALPARV